jgi:hypothetical protein
MKKILLMILGIIPLLAFSQNKKHIPCILVIDNEVEFFFNNGKFLIIDKQDSIKDSISVNYVPGELSFSKENYEKLLMYNESYKIHFVCDIATINNNAKKIYKIEFNLSCIKQPYIIFKIHNINHEENKKIYYYAKKSEGYVYDIKTASISILAPRRVGKKK